MTCSRRHSIQCVMTSDSPPGSPISRPLQPAASGRPCHRRISTACASRCASLAGDSVVPSSVGRRRKTATATRLQGSSIAALAAVARTPLLIGAVNHRKKSLPDNMPFRYVHHSPAASRQRKVLLLPPLWIGFTSHPTQNK